MICRHPGCGRRLDSKNISGVCRDHNHSHLCECSQCVAKSRKPPATKTKKPSQASTAVVSARHRSNRVSLPVMPWEVEA